MLLSYSPPKISTSDCFPQILVSLFPIVKLWHKWLVWDNITLQPSLLVSSVQPAIERNGERPDPVETPSWGYGFYSTPIAQVKLSVPSVIHFYSTLATFSTQTSLRHYKAKWFLTAACCEVFSPVPSSVQRCLARHFWKIHLPFLPFHQSFLSASELSFPLIWVPLLSQKPPCASSYVREAERRAEQMEDF